MVKRDNRIAYPLLLLFGGAGVVIRFLHPSLTETELFLQFWWAWLAIAGGCFLVGWFLMRR